MCSIEDRVGNFVVGKEFDAILVQTGQGEAREDGAPAQSEAASLEDEVEKALAGAATEEESEGPGNPALLVTPDEPIERVFEKFLFAVRRLVFLFTPSSADSLAIRVTTATWAVCSCVAASLAVRVPSPRRRLPRTMFR